MANQTREVFINQARLVPNQSLWFTHQSNFMNSSLKLSLKILMNLFIKEKNYGILVLLTRRCLEQQNMEPRSFFSVLIIRMMNVAQKVGHRLLIIYRFIRKLSTPKIINYSIGEWLGIREELGINVMKSWGSLIHSWIVSENNYNSDEPLSNKIDWIRAPPFLIITWACLLVFYVRFSWIAVSTALVLNFFRLFTIGAFYHRYFSHKAFKTNRFWQFIFAKKSQSIDSDNFTNSCLILI